MARLRGSFLSTVFSSKTIGLAVGLVFIAVAGASVRTAASRDATADALAAVQTNTPTPTMTGTPTGGCGENFDSVFMPALPVGWSSTATGSGVPWTTSEWITAHTFPNAALAPAPATVGNSELFSPVYLISPSGGAFSFRMAYDFEMSADGMVLEISIDGGAYQDILTAGGGFSGGGYTGTINQATSPINGRAAWTGNSASILTIVMLPAAANGHNIQLKWRSATDDGQQGPGPWIDSVVGIPCIQGDATPTASMTETFTPTPMDTPSVSGTITYGNALGNPPAPRPIPNVSVASAIGSPPVGPVLTDSMGMYTLTGFGPGEYSIRPTRPGGPNAAISSNDAARIAQAVTGSAPIIHVNQGFSADVSGNGSVSSNDAALIARFAAGLSGFGNAGQWKFFCPPGAPSPLPTPGGTPVLHCVPSTVPGPITGVDLLGFLVGDVTGNWAPSAARSAPSLENNVIVELPSLAAQPDKEIVIPVRAEGAAKNANVISYEFDLRYDPRVIQPQADPVDVAGTASRGLSAVANPKEPGLLRVVVYGPMPIDEDGVLLNLRFTAVGAAGSVSPLMFEHFMFNEGDPQTAITDGKIELL